MMEVWVITHPTKLSEPLYQTGLGLVDEESVARIKRFYRREDSCREFGDAAMSAGLQQTLFRVLLSERGISAESITFDKTKAGKPFFKTPHLDPPLAFNISHDSEVVAMVFGPGESKSTPGPGRLGVDIMKCKLPPREPFRNFVNTVGETLTPLEKAHLLSLDPARSANSYPQSSLSHPSSSFPSHLPPDSITTSSPPDPTSTIKPLSPLSRALKSFFQIWTLKEAYTKSLGLGLGFDFSRIECACGSSSDRGRFTVDGKKPEGGWTVRLFEVDIEGDGEYVGVAMSQDGEREGEGEGELVVRKSEEEGGCKVVEIDAEVFVRRAVKALTGQECAV